VAPLPEVLDDHLGVISDDRRHRFRRRRDRSRMTA
jgi:hypothetical protein